MIRDLALAFAIGIASACFIYAITIGGRELLRRVRRSRRLRAEYARRRRRAS